jgi:hypothetical protein
LALGGHFDHARPPAALNFRFRGKADSGMAISHWPTVQLDSAADTLHNQTRIFARLVLALEACDSGFEIRHAKRAAG